jgi:hypothetical protein
MIGLEKIIRGIYGILDTGATTLSGRLKPPAGLEYGTTGSTFSNYDAGPRNLIYL